VKPILFDPPESPYLVAYDGGFCLADAATSPPKGEGGKKRNEQVLADAIDRMRERQRVLYADDRVAVLLVFQAMDAAGKDGTIRAVLSGINPAGCQVYSFSQPSSTELDHDFLWRVARCCPERGRIGVFNRSHYEEVLVVRVHPEYLGGQKLPRQAPLAELWQERFESIRAFERHLARNGTAIVKFWLNVSPEEQRRRFLDRIDQADSNWKFSAQDVDERERWDDYMAAYEAALCATSRPWAPWYAIPADDKPFMRATVADIIARTLEGLALEFPAVSDADRAEMRKLRALLEGDG
jgi:PPK2 family polyphosphate:nucleotide phosphotransferase